MIRRSRHCTEEPDDTSVHADLSANEVDAKVATLKWVEAKVSEMKIKFTTASRLFVQFQTVFDLYATLPPPTATVMASDSRRKNAHEWEMLVTLEQ